MTTTKKTKPEAKRWLRQMLRDRDSGAVVSGENPTVAEFLEAEKEKAKAEEAERDEDLRYLTEHIGATEEDARLRLRDGDLWVLNPASRFGAELEGEEGVRQWEATAELVSDFSQFVTDADRHFGWATIQLVWDARDRAQEALRRARLRQRLEE